MHFVFGYQSFLTLYLKLVEKIVTVIYIGDMFSIFKNFLYDFKRFIDKRASGLKNFFTKLILGNYTDTHKPNPAISSQWAKVKKVWNNEEYKDFGIERIIRLFLVISPFIFPNLYIRHYTGKFGLIARKLGVEFYVIVKLFLPIFILIFNLSSHDLFLYLSIYMLTETIVYLLSLIFLSDSYTKPISYKRSILLILMNFIEIGLEFSVIYAYFNTHCSNFFVGNIHSTFDIVYFSFVSFITLGFGDIYVVNSIGKLLVLIQIIIFLLFLGIVLNIFVGSIGEETFFNKKEKKGKGKK